MPLYSFVCNECRFEELVGATDLCVICERCGTVMKRQFGFNFKRPMQEHYNPSVGSYVNTEREFKDGLKRKSEEMTARTGMVHNYQPIDPTDRAAVGVTDEGLDSTYRQMAKEGKIEVKKWL